MILSINSISNLYPNGMMADFEFNAILNHEILLLTIVIDFKSMNDVKEYI